ncbi:eCIS core domain-containing protein [Denitromonas iodatirespirans]|uniref:DUF4157 domain-containing protein n=1 Tax=Denitromonas iodatirespirans TaxID=2795389 RepID=A0A944D4V6_DENI1|nr:DUF4157 domain-containing protein [Denitromonas iodatirespirans]MBT0959885.1 DUF4157 domain-containing protein [Denitromonas iodatirespirans]
MSEPIRTSRRCASTPCGVTVPSLTASVLRSPGRPLDSGTRALMEHRFGEDLGDIRLHTDAAAAQSADALSARAYTVGRHIVFGPEGYSPQAPAGRQRLAHELTHALQQRRPGGADLSTAQREGEARQAARSLATGAAMPAISAARPAISRDPVPGAEDDASFQASMAEATCDIGTLCRLSLRAPEAVSRTRLLQIYRACHPGVSLTSLVAGNPCLTPNFGLPARPQAAGPRSTMHGPQPAAGGAPAPAAGGGLSLPSTTIAFGLGPAAVTIDLPASLAVRLPVPFQGAERVVFALNASPSEFSFSVTVNAVPHVRIIARASMTTEGRGAAGLTVQTTRTVCRAVEPAAARSALEAAGTRLRDAIQAVQTPPAPDPEASELSRTFAPQARLAEVVAAVANVHSEIERVSAPCREVPVAEFEFGAQGQLTAPDTPPTPGTLPPASFIGGSLRLHF